MKRLTLICGPSGIGKSTLAEALLDKVGGVWREADTYFMSEDGHYVFTPQDLNNAHTWCQQECKEWMEAGCDNIIISNTFTTEWERRPYIEHAKNYGYEIVIVHMEAVRGLDACTLANRSVHSVPVHVISSQLDRLRK